MRPIYQTLEYVLPLLALYLEYNNSINSCTNQHSNALIFNIRKNVEHRRSDNLSDRLILLNPTERLKRQFSLQNDSKIALQIFLTMKNSTCAVV